MKPKNFPARKLARQISAQRRNGECLSFGECVRQLDEARAVRTKKRRALRA